MLYKVECPTPANTPKNKPVIVRCRVYPGKVTRVWVGFPQGCFGLCHLQVWHQGLSIWPWSPADSFHWNDYMFTFTDSFPLTAEPYEFVIKTWNYDDFYAHTLVFMVMVDPALPELSLTEIRQVYEDLGLLQGSL